MKFYHCVHEPQVSCEVASADVWTSLVPKFSFLAYRRLTTIRCLTKKLSKENYLNGRKNFNTKERVQVCGWFFIVFYFECVLPNARAHYFCLTFFIVFSSVSLALSVLLRSTVCAKLPRKHPSKIDDFHQRC